jgi:hypothetical protein
MDRISRPGPTDLGHLTDDLRASLIEAEATPGAWPDPPTAGIE